MDYRITVDGVAHAVNVTGAGVARYLASTADLAAAGIDAPAVLMTGTLAPAAATYGAQVFGPVQITGAETLEDGTTLIFT